MLTLQQFYEKYRGQEDVGNTYVNKGECVGLVMVWTENLGIPHTWGHAEDLYDNALTAHFDKIPNTPDAVPKDGDIIVWDYPWDEFGHTGIAYGYHNTEAFDCFQQNHPLNSTPHVRRYNYNYVIGWLRPKAYQEGGEDMSENDVKGLVQLDKSIILLNEHGIIPTNAREDYVNDDKYVGVINGLITETQRQSETIKDLQEQNDNYEEINGNQSQLITELEQRNKQLQQELEACENETPCPTQCPSWLKKLNKWFCK